MRVLITGELGFIAKNLKKVFEDTGHTVVNPDDIRAGLLHLPTTGEVCVYRNSESTWSDVFKRGNIDVVVHNAAVVGTDVVALNPSEAVLSNVQGTYNIVRAANSANCGVCYLGTTVIYDTPKYQDTFITEESDKRPLTYYGIQKLAGEQIVTSIAKKWSIVRPLFAFGGQGDMNSLIAKSIYAGLHNKNIDMFLDPAKVKDYLHVSDFCNAVKTVCQEPVGWGTDWNVSAETPVPAGEIIKILQKVIGTTVEHQLRWKSSTDYLGNHRLSSKKIREKLGWKPALNLEEGIGETLKWIHGSKDYNPLRYLEQAREAGIDLLQHFPKHKS